LAVAGLVLGAVGTSLSAAGEPEVDFTLSTYNLHVGVPMGKEIGQQIVGTAEFDAQCAQLAKAKADIMALQEVDSDFGYDLPAPRRRTSMVAMPRYMSAHFACNYVFGSAQDDISYPSDNAEYVEWGTAKQWQNNEARHGEVGNALLTKFPLIGAPRVLSLPRLPDKERRSCIRAEIQLTTEPAAAKSASCVVYATHLQHDSASSRGDQMKSILQNVQMESSGTLIFIMGDFNAAASDGPADQNPVGIALAAGFHDLYGDWEKAHSASPAGTYPADKPTARIDYILCNQPIKVVNAGIIPGLASDHLPVYVRIEVPSGF
jgi:endonuclease/exonuclease/phosphatase family metal-dependent hydrolase